MLDQVECARVSVYMTGGGLRKWETEIENKILKVREKGRAIGRYVGR